MRISMHIKAHVHSAHNPLCTSLIFHTFLPHMSQYSIVFSKKKKTTKVQSRPLGLGGGGHVLVRKDGSPEYFNLSAVTTNISEPQF